MRRVEDRALALAAAAEFAQRLYSREAIADVSRLDVSRELARRIIVRDRCASFLFFLSRRRLSDAW